MRSGWRVKPRMRASVVSAIQPADGVPESDIGGRAGARRLADGRLVDLEHPADRLPARDRLAAMKRPSRAARATGAAGRATQALEIAQQHVARQRGFAGSRHAGDHRQAAERNARIDLAKIVQRRAGDLDRWACRASTGRRRDARMPQRRGQTAAGRRIGSAARVPRRCPAPRRGRRGCRRRAPDR